MSQRTHFVEVANAYTPKAMPSKHWGRIRPFVMDIVHTLVIPTVTTLPQLRAALVALSQDVYVASTSGGCALEVEEIFSPAMIEYVVSRFDVTTRVKGTRRSLLVGIGKRLNPHWPVGDDRAHYGYLGPDAPYTDAQLTQLRNWATTRATQYQRYHAMLLLALGCGCGLRAGEIAKLRGRDIRVESSGMVIVTVSGFRGQGPRSIAARCQWETIVARRARGIGDNELVVFHRRSKDTTQSLAAILTRIGKPTELDFDTHRLRTTWIVSLMHDRVPDSIIIQAAGLRDLRHFSKYRPTMNDADCGVLDLLRGPAPTVVGPWQVSGW